MDKTAAFIQALRDEPGVLELLDPQSPEELGEAMRQAFQDVVAKLEEGGEQNFRALMAFSDVLLVFLRAGAPDEFVDWAAVWQALGR